jgi:orotidine-5'-phosphate decarboxylase
VSAAGDENASTVAGLARAAEAATSTARAKGFGERVTHAVAARSSQLVLGLDPDPGRLWPRAVELAGGAGEAGAPPAQRAALAMTIHCTLAIEAVGDQCVAVKPQLACFERLGAPGWAALAEVVQRGQEQGLLVIADAKRGDIDVSAAAYAQAFFGATATPYGSVPGLGADAITASPLLGADSLAPLVDAARAHKAGVFVLVHTSNDGAADIQELDLAGGGTVSERLAELVNRLGAPTVGPGGLADVGAVVGATAPEWIERLRELMPTSVFLLPGVGAQGGRVEDLAGAFSPGRAGGLVTASRGVVRAHEHTGGDPAMAARAEAQRLRELAWRLSG